MSGITGLLCAASSDAMTVEEAARQLLSSLLHCGPDAVEIGAEL
jgi:hypothetical protein